MSFSIRGLLIFLLSFPIVASALNDEHFTIVEKNQKKGLFDENGNVLIPVAYDDLGWSFGMPEVFHKVIGYQEGNLWGLIGIKNKKISQAQYTSLIPFQEKLLIASVRDKKQKSETRFGLINTKGETELSFRYRSLAQHQTQLIASILRNHKPQFGVINQEGEAVIGFDYLKINPVSVERYAVTDLAGKTALFDHEGAILSDFKYDSISSFTHQLAIIYQDGKQGIIHENGTEMISPQYQRIKIDGPQSVSVLPFNTWHVYTAENKWLRDYTFETIQPVGTNLYQVSLGQIKTFVNQEGEPIIPPNWQVKELSGDFAVLTEGDKLGVLRSEMAPEAKHQVVVPLEYDSLLIDGQYILAAKKIDGRDSWTLFNNQGVSLTSFAYQALLPQSEGRFLAQRKDRWGYLDTTGLEVVPCQYLTASPFSGGVASIDCTDGQGVIDTQGNWKIKPLNYQGARLSLERVHDDLYIFQTEPQKHESARFGLINSQGEKLFTSFNHLANNGHSIWEQSAEGKYGLVDYWGERMLEVQYDTISALQDDHVYIFRKEGKYGILDREGKKLVDVENDFQELYPMSDGFLGVKINHKYGFVDELGRLRIANRYDSITHFNDNMAAVKLLGRWGYINKSERLIVQPRFERATPFHGKLALVEKNNLVGLVNRQGKAIIPLKYSKITPGKEHRYKLHSTREINGEKLTQVGLAADNGSMLIHPKYDHLEDLGNGYVIVDRKGRYGLLKLSGLSTIPLKHDGLVYDSFNDVYLALEKPTWQTLDLAKIQ